MAADGRVLIDTKIDTTGIVTGTDDVIKAARRMATQVDGLSNSVKSSFARQADSIQKAARVYDEQKEKVIGLREKLRELQNQKIPTDEYKNLETEIKKNESALEKLIEKKRQLEEAGKSSVLTSEYKEAAKEVDQLEKKLNQLLEKQNKWDIYGAPSGKAYGILEYDIENITEKLRLAKEEKDRLESKSTQKSDTFKNIQNDIDATNQKLENLRAARGDMEGAGVAFTMGDTAAIESTTAKLAHEEARLAEMNRSLETSYNSLADKVNKYASSIASNGLIAKLKNLAKAAQKAALSLAQLAGRGIVGGLKKITTGIFGLDKATKKNNASLGMSLKTMIKYGIGVESLFTLISKLRSVMQEGMKNLAQYSGNTNATISGLMSSLEQCKNALATAFDPILQAVAPALNYLISLVTAAATAVAQLIAALTGKNTFVKAAKVQKDYAKSLSGTGSAAKKAGEDAEGSLASFDKLNVMAEENAGGSGSGGGGGGGISPDEMFETVPVESHFKDLADKIKEMWGGIFDTLKRAWDSKGQAVIDSAKAAFASLVDAAKAVGLTFYEVFTSDVGVAWVESILELLRSALDVIRSVASTFTIAWNSGAGLENATALFNMYTNINMLLASIGDSFSRVFSNGTGVAIWTNILGIITGVWNVAGNLAGSINEAWNTSGVGDGIWQGILNIVNTILGTIHNITDATAEWASRLDFTPLLTSINELLKSLEPLTENIGSGLEWFWNNVLLPIANWTIKEAVPKFLDMLSSAIGALNKVIEVIKPVAQWFWNEFLEPFGKWAGEKIIQAIEKVNSLFESFGNWITEHKEEVQQFVTIIGLLTGAFVGANVAIAVVTGALPLLGAALSGVIGILTGPVGIIAALAALVVATGNGQEMIENLKTVLDGLIDFVVGVFTGDWDRAWEGIGKIVDGVVGGILTLIDSIVEAAKKALEWLGILDEKSNVTKNAFDVAKGIAGSKKPMPMQLHASIPPSSDPVHLPRLASGTVVPPRAGEFAAILGDNRRETEVVSPLSTMKQALREALLDAGGMGGGDISLTVNLDGRVVYQDVIKRNRMEKDRTGLNPLLV